MCWLKTKRKYLKFWFLGQITWNNEEVRSSISRSVFSRISWARRISISLFLRSSFTLCNSLSNVAVGVVCSIISGVATTPFSILNALQI